MDKISSQVKEAGEKALAEAAKGVQMSTANKEKVDELLMKQGELQANLQGAQQLLAKLEANGAGGDVQHQSLGQQFVNNEKVKSFLGETTPRGRADMTIKAAITSVTTDTDGAAGDLVRPPVWQACRPCRSAA